MHAWTVPTLPKVLWQTVNPPKPTKSHLHTEILPQAGSCVGLTGQSVWVADVAGGIAAVTWDWVAARPNVFALQAPFYIVSNLDLVDDEGEPLLPQEAVLYLNQLVYDLGWQAKLRRYIKALPERSRRAERSCDAAQSLSVAGQRQGRFRPYL